MLYDERILFLIKYTVVRMRMIGFRNLGGAMDERCYVLPALRLISPLA